jgi:hypothetical protein
MSLITRNYEGVVITLTTLGNLKTHGNEIDFPVLKTM